LTHKQFSPYSHRQTKQLNKPQTMKIKLNYPILLLLLNLSFFSCSDYQNTITIDSQNTYTVKYPYPTVYGEVMNTEISSFDPNKACKIILDSIELELQDSIMNYRLSKFIVEHNKVNRLDCAAFIHALHNIRYSKYSLDIDKWNINTLTNSNISNLKAGDCIILTENFDEANEKISHYALHLKNGIFLSVFGAGGSLRTTNIKNLKKFYPCEGIYKITPKTKFVTQATLE